MATRHGFSRTSRVAEQIRRELADLIRFHVKDQRLATKLVLVTLTDVEVTADYSHAKVFYTSLSAESDNETIAAGLRHLAGYFRRELGHRMSLHKIPELHFVYDESVARGTYLSQLIGETIAADKKTSHD
uniref:Ribosome-binding factor A n=1 Tax=uncultured bacterium UPO33 TaxID=1776960 RepID=A0A126SXH2_9BACT|nr:ribosome-binding factor A [uncultured bacterium UPO33]